jgi:hypothetical protein
VYHLHNLDGTSNRYEKFVLHFINRYRVYVFFGLGLLGGFGLWNSWIHHLLSLLLVKYRLLIRWLWSVCF